MVKICFLADGHSVHTKKWLAFFSGRGYVVHLISFRPSGIPEVNEHLLQWSLPVPISQTTPGYLKVRYLFSLSTVRRLIRQISPGILHAHWATSYGLLGACSGHHPFVLSPWGSDVYRFPHRSFMHRRILQFTINRADVITATSRALTEETTIYLKQKKTIQTIPFGVDLARFRPCGSKDAGTVTIGTVKGLEKTYGLDHLIRAFARLHQSNPKVKLMIVGRGSQADALRRLCVNVGVEKSVTFIGAVENEKVPEYLNKMDIFVIPSLEESFGVAAVEAAACQLPVIASAVGGLPEVVVDGETGYLVPPRDAGAIADRLALLVTHTELRRRMGQAGRALVEKQYDWARNAERMEQLYRDIYEHSLTR